MIANKRSDFYYTLEEDEQKCIASIQRIEQKIKNRHTKIQENNSHS